MNKKEVKGSAYLSLMETSEPSSPGIENLLAKQQQNDIYHYNLP